MKKLREFDFLRAVAALLVILIHVSADYYYLDSSGFTYKLWGSVNVLSQIAVYVFLFISAFLLAYSAVNKEEQGTAFRTLPFYARRLDKVLLPYLCWTAIYLLFYYLLGSGIISPFNEPWRFAKTYLLLGNASFHLYYVVVALQLYFLFPLFMLLHKALKLRAGNCLASLLALLSVCMLAYAVMKLDARLFPQFAYKSTLLYTYLPPVLMGLWFGFRIERLEAVLNKLPVLGAACIALAALSIMQYIFGVFIVDAYFMLLMRMVYAVVAALLLLALFRRQKESNAVSKLLLCISDNSFFIYLAHPIFLTLNSRYMHLGKLFTTGSYFLNFSLGVLLNFLFCLICSLALGILCRRLRLNKFLG